MTPLLLVLLLGAQSTGQMSPTSDVSSNRVRATGRTYSRSNADRAADVVNVLDFIPTNLHTSIRARTDTHDLSSYLQAAINAAFATGGEVFFPPGMYTSNAALTIPTAGLAGTNVALRGTKGASWIMFTGATDGLVVADNVAGVGPRRLAIDGLAILTTNPNAGKALSFDCPNYACVKINVSDVEVSKADPGMWAYGIFGDNFQTSALSDVYIWGSSRTCIRLQNSSNSVHFYAIECTGGANVERGIDIEGDSAPFFHGGTVQGAFSASMVRIVGSYGHLTGMHLEQTGPDNTDGADVVVGSMSRGRFITPNAGGASFITTGTAPELVVIGGDIGDVTLGDSTVPSTFLNVNMSDLVDNSGHNLTVVVGSRSPGGGARANEVPAPDRYLRVIDPEDATTVAINTDLYSVFFIDVGVAAQNNSFTVGFPPVGKAKAGDRITIRVRNLSGGVMGGTVTFNSNYRMVSWVNPATDGSTSIDFDFDGYNWIESGRSADIPN